MTDEQKYLFDLQGFIVLKGVIPQTVVDACNAILDDYENMPPDDYPPPTVPRHAANGERTLHLQYFGGG